MKIYTEIDYRWDDETSQLVEVSNKSFDYDGEIAEMKGGGGGPQTVTNKTEPWDAAKPYYESMYQTASDLAEMPQSFYPGQTLANINPYQTTGQEMQASWASNVADPTLQLGTQQVQNVLAGNYLSPTSNPYLSDAVQGAVGDVFTQYNEKIAPQIRSEAIRAGGLGGSRQGVAEALAQRDALSKASSMAENMYMSNYEGQMGNLMNMIGRTPQYLQGAMLPGQTLEQIGATQRSQEQDIINEAIADWTRRDEAPWSNIQNLSAALQGGQFRNAYSTYPGMQSNAIQNVAGLGLMGAGLFNS